MQRSRRQFLWTVGLGSTLAGCMGGSLQTEDGEAPERPGESPDKGQNPLPIDWFLIPSNTIYDGTTASATGVHIEAGGAIANGAALTVEAYNE